MRNNKIYAHAKTLSCYFVTQNTQSQVDEQDITSPRDEQVTQSQVDGNSTSPKYEQVTQA